MSVRHEQNIPTDYVLVSKDDWESVRSALSAIYEVLNRSGQEVSPAGGGWDKIKSKQTVAFDKFNVEAMKVWAGDCLELTFNQKVT